MSTNLRSENDAWHDRVFQQEPGQDDAVTPWYSLVREYLGDMAGLSVSEVACGRGGFVHLLKKTSARVTGCDFSMGALRAARRRAAAERNEPGTWLVQGDVQRLPFADNTFDRVIAGERWMAPAQWSFGDPADDVCEKIFAATHGEKLWLPLKIRKEQATPLSSTCPQKSTADG